MKGRNTIILNKATMIEALTEYFGKRMRPPVGVTNCEPDRSGSGGGHLETYKVTLEELDETPIDDGGVS